MMLSPRREIWYNGRMRNTIQGPKVTWVDIQNPTKEDVDFLRDTYQFHPLTLQDIIPPGLRTKVVIFPGYFFFILQYPVYDKQRKEIRPRELDVIVTKNAIVTTRYNTIVPMKALFDKCNLYEEDREEYMGRGAGYLLFHILEQCWESCFTKLARINEELNKIEEGIFQSKEKEMIYEISLAKTDIINFWRIVDPQQEILEILKKEGPRFFGEELAPYFSHILSDYRHVRNDLRMYEDAIRALEETTNSLLTTKMNEIIKTLTIFSVSVLPLTLLAAIFGMNTQYLPFMGLPGDFWIIAGIMISGIFGVIFYFKKRKWI